MGHREKRAPRHKMRLNRTRVFRKDKEQILYPKSNEKPLQDVKQKQNIIHFISWITLATV